jgi:hypothetical protein
MGSQCWVGYAIARNKTTRKSRKAVQLEMTENWIAARGSSIHHFASGYWGNQLPVPGGS